MIDEKVIASLELWKPDGAKSYAFRSGVDSRPFRVFFVTKKTAKSFEYVERILKKVP